MNTHQTPTEVIATLEYLIANVWTSAQAREFAEAIKSVVDISDRYDEGYDEGRVEGRVEGYDEGYDEGRVEGRVEGYDEGYDAGVESTRL